MKKTYTQVVKQIESLKQEAEKLRRQEIDGVVARIREAIDHYGLTAQDLGLSGARGPAAKKTAAGKTAPQRTRRGGRAKGAAPAREPKYRDEQGRTWGGVGKRPQWLRDALASGKSLQDFAVQ